MHNSQMEETKQSVYATLLILQRNEYTKLHTAYSHFKHLIYYDVD